MRQNNHSSGLPELALRVDEREAGRFFWVLLAAGDPSRVADVTEALHYRPYRAATEPQSVYWDALLLGMAELRRVLATDTHRQRTRAAEIQEAQRRM